MSTWALFCVEGPTVPPPNLGLLYRVGPLLCEMLLSRGLTLRAMSYLGNVPLGRRLA